MKVRLLCYHFSCLFPFLFLCPVVLSHRIIGEVGYDARAEKWDRFGLDYVASYQDHITSNGSLLNFPLYHALNSVFTDKEKAPMSSLATYWKQHEAVMK